MTTPNQAPKTSPTSQGQDQRPKRHVFGRHKLPTLPSGYLPPQPPIITKTAEQDHKLKTSRKTRSIIQSLPPRAGQVKLKLNPKIPRTDRPTWPTDGTNEPWLPYLTLLCLTEVHYITVPTYLNFVLGIAEILSFPHLATGDLLLPASSFPFHSPPVFADRSRGSSRAEISPPAWGGLGGEERGRWGRCFPFFPLFSPLNLNSNTALYLTVCLLHTYGPFIFTKVMQLQHKLNSKTGIAEIM